jgi:hypothetical protein
MGAVDGSTADALHLAGARAALEQVCAPRAVAEGPVRLERQVLALLVEGHASERGIARCPAEQGRAVSLGAISAVVTEAEPQALAVMAQPFASGTSSLT